jgi:hypothetical protein
MSVNRVGREEWIMFPLHASGQSSMDLRYWVLSGGTERQSMGPWKTGVLGQ